MAVFVDTGVVYAQAHQGAPRNELAKDALRPVLQGELGRPFVSDYVVDEAFTLARARTGRLSIARAVVDRLRGGGDQPDVFTLLWVHQDVFETALDCLDRYPDHDLSFTDATTVALIDAHGIDHLLSFDDGFDGVVDRLPPSVVAEGRRP